MERIVVGIDGSETAHHALAWAVSEARLRQAELEVVHAWQLPHIGGDPYSVAFEPQPFEEDARRTLANAIEAQDVSGLPRDVRPVLVYSSPAQAILDASKGADLVVVGSRGRGGFSELLLGSVSHQVAHHARCAVVIVPAVE